MFTDGQRVQYLPHWGTPDGWVPATIVRVILPTGLFDRILGVRNPVYVISLTGEPNLATSPETLKGI